MKSKKILGIPIMMFIIGLVVLGGASAAVVSYLSNSVTADIHVDSPIEMSMSSTHPTWEGLDSIDLGSLYGGETATLYMRSTNLANVPTDGYTVNTISNDEGLTCADFTYIGAQTLKKTNGVGPDTFTTLYDITTNCVVLDAETVQINYGPNPNTLGVDVEDTTKMQITLAPGASGDYNFDSQVMN